MHWSEHASPNPALCSSPGSAAAPSANPPARSFPPCAPHPPVSGKLPFGRGSVGAQSPPASDCPPPTVSFPRSPSAEPPPETPPATAPLTPPSPSLLQPDSAPPPDAPLQLAPHLPGPPDFAPRPATEPAPALRPAVAPPQSRRKTFRSCQRNRHRRPPRPPVVRSHRVKEFHSSDQYLARSGIF